jgi:hypothetical protein
LKQKDKLQKEINMSIIKEEDIEQTIKMKRKGFGAETNDISTYSE